MRPAVDRAVPARLLTDPHAVGDLGRHGAADRAMRADAFADSYFRAAGRRPSLCLAHAGERQTTQSAETTGEEARPPEEGATVDVAICLARESGQTAALGPTLRSLDQHGCLPHFG